MEITCSTPRQRRCRPTTLTRQDIRLLGAGLELGAASRGTLMGPDALRTAGLVRVLRDLGHRVTDCGSLHEVPPAAVAMAPALAARCRHLEAIAGWTRASTTGPSRWREAGGVPVFLGGDHSISMGSISGVARPARRAGRKLAVLWLDAHADYNTPETTPSGNLHGMALAMLAGEPSLAAVLGDRPLAPVAPEQLHVFGARSVDPEERARLKADGSTWWTCGRSTSAASRRCWPSGSRRGGRRGCSST